MGVVEVPKIWAQVLSIAIACLTSLGSGLLFTWPSPSIPQLTSPDHPLGITLEQASYLTVIPPVAAAICSFPASKLVDKIGRKRCLLFIALPQLVAWILISLEHSLWLFYLSRFFVGVGDAFSFGALPTYIAEVSTPKVRGSWGNLMPFFINVGALVMNAVGAYCDIPTSAHVLVSVPLLFLLLYRVIPESPYFLIAKGRQDEAIAALKWLRQADDVDAEFKDISKALKRQMAERGSLQDLWTNKSNRMALAICVVCRFTQQYSGIAAFMVYCQQLFAEAGGGLSASSSSIIFNLVLTLGTVLASFLQNYFGRKKTMVSSGGCCTVLLVLIAVYLHLDISAIPWLPTAGMLLYIVSFSLGLGVVPTMLLGEVFSSSIKANALAAMNIVFAACVGSGTKIFQLLMSNLGMFSCFYFYGVCCLVGSVACYYIMIETKDKTLEEIQLQLKGDHKREVPYSKDVSVHI